MTESFREDINFEEDVGEEDVEDTDSESFEDKVRKVVRDDISFIGPLVEERERILLWTLPLNTPVRDCKTGWYIAVEEIDRKKDKISHVIRIAYDSLRREKRLGFPCSYLNLPDKEIDLRCRLPYWWEFEKEPETRAEKTEQSLGYMRLLIGCHSLGISYRNPRNPVISYNSSDDSKRKDLRSYGEFVRSLKFKLFEDEVKICTGEYYKIPPIKKLWNVFFHQYEPPPQTKTYIGRRRVIPSSDFLMAVYEECMKYPEDDCRFFFLAFDWVYRVSEIIKYEDNHTIVETIVSMCRRLLDLPYENIDEELRRQIILLLDGMLIMEPLYRYAKNGGDVLLFWNNCIRESLEEPSKYYDYPTLIQSFRFMSRNTELDINVRMKDL